MALRSAPQVPGVSRAILPGAADSWIVRSGGVRRSDERGIRQRYMGLVNRTRQERYTRIKRISVVTTKQHSSSLLVMKGLSQRYLRARVS